VTGSCSCWVVACPSRHIPETDRIAGCSSGFRLMSLQSDASTRLSSFTLILGLPHNSPTIGQMTLIFKALQAQYMPGIHFHLKVSTKRLRVYLSSLMAWAHLDQALHIIIPHDLSSHHAHPMHPTSRIHVQPAASSLPLSLPLQTSTSTVIEHLNLLFRRDQVCTLFSAREVGILLRRCGLHILRRMALVLRLLRMRLRSVMLCLNRVGNRFSL